MRGRHAARVVGSMALSPDGRRGRSPTGSSTSGSSPARDVATDALSGYNKGVSLAENVGSAGPAGRTRDVPSSHLPDRKTKIVCTIGPATWSRDTFCQLADSGMNVARLNMSHGDHASHGAVVDLVREYNATTTGPHVAVLLDTKGPEVRSGDLPEPIVIKQGDKFTFTTQPGADGRNGRIGINYDGFVDDVSVGDILLVDGGIQSMKVTGIEGSDVHVEVIDGGKFGSRRHLNIRGKSANLPAITDRDWDDIKFGVQVGVDYYALSFVRDAAVIYELKEWLAKQGAKIGVLAKIESADSVENLEEILDAVDGAMVARGDLGAELPVEEVPYWQNAIVQGCRKRGKPVIVATNMLESMITNPAPTRAEVSDIAIAVREGADAIMLSGETAYGKFPFKAVEVMDVVARRTEASMLSYMGTRRYGSEESAPIDWIIPMARRVQDDGGLTTPGMSEMIAYHSTTMANTVKTSLIVFSRKGNMPALLSHYRPDFPTYCFTESEEVLRRLALYHGVKALAMEFADTAEETFDRAMELLRVQGYVRAGQQVAIVQSGRQPIWRSTSTHIIQVRMVPADPTSTMSEEDDIMDIASPKSTSRKAASNGSGSKAAGNTNGNGSKRPQAKPRAAEELKKPERKE